jgi:hypothetical protein
MIVSRRRQQESAMNALEYHSKRAMQEFHAGMVATNPDVSDAHLRLSSLHMAHADELARVAREARRTKR